MEFKALNVPGLTEEMADNLVVTLQQLEGIQHLSIKPETRELNIVFNENQLSFQSLAHAMAQAGCPLHHIGAALIY